MSRRVPVPSCAAHAAVVPPVRVGQGVTKRRAEGPHWVRTGHGLYVPAHVPQTPEQRIVQGAALLRPKGAVTGWGALRWLGGAWFEGMAPGGKEYADVQLTCDHRRPWPGIEVCEEGLDPREVAVVDGVPVTHAVRSVVFLMRYASSLREAVRAFDMAAYNDLVSYDEVAAYAACHRGWTGIPQARKALEHCDENAWSPTEVDMRLCWQLDGGMPRPLTNVPLFTLDGHHIGTPDLVDPVNAVIGEYDGSLHLVGARRSRDIRREARFRDHGFEVVTMVAGDRLDTADLLTRLHAAYARADRHRDLERTWTRRPPPWWVETRTVAQRRALTDEQRRRFLALRRTVA